MRKKPKEWRQLEEEHYDRFRIFDIRRSKRLNPRSGKAHDFFLMRGLDWVNVIPLTSENEVVLVRQYRHGSETFTIETPGGCVEQSESPLEAAVRELLEETGHKASSLQALGTIYPNPAMQAMRCYCFLAKDAKKISDQKLDEGEDVEVVTLPLDSVKSMILSGEISHSIVLAAFGLMFMRSNIV